MSVPTTAPEVVVDGKVTVIILGSNYKIIDEPALESGIGEVLVELASNLAPPAIVLDLTEVQFFGSSFIEIMFRVWNRLQSRSGRFAVCGLCPHCEDVLKVTHLDTLWPLFPTRQQAVAEIEKTFA